MFVNISREAGISLFTSQGESKISSAGETITETTQTRKGRVFPALNEHVTLGFVDEIKHFLSSLSTGQKATETFEEGYLVNKIVDAAYASAKSGSWEAIKED